MNILLRTGRLRGRISSSTSRNRELLIRTGLFVLLLTRIHRAGPRKLGKALVLALKRWRGFRANKPWSTDLSGWSAEGSSYFPSPPPNGTNHSPDTSSKSEPGHEEESTETSTPGRKESAVKEPEHPSEKTADPPAATINQQPRHDPNAESGPSTEYLLVDDNKINIQVLHPCSHIFPVRSSNTGPRFLSRS